jgi:hypothetical protein
MNACPYGFRIVGAVAEPRRLVNASAALVGYAACDAKANVEREAYLSAFQYPADVRRFIDAFGAGSMAGYAGPCWAPFVWFDIDRNGNLEAALTSARRLATCLDERFKLPDESLLVFLSGGKGFHVGLPTGLWGPEPSPLFHRVCRAFAGCVAGAAGVAIDAGVYDAVRPFRAPNSRHPRTGLHKRRLSLDELMGLSLTRIVELAASPAPFDLPTPRANAVTATLPAADWQHAVEQVTRQGEVKAARRAAGNGPTLNRATLAFIRDGASNGDRHRLLFSAAANLAEFGCTPALAHALLSESALDAGLAPKDVRRQIDCGLKQEQPHFEPPQAESELPAASPSQVEPHNGAALQEKLRALWARGSKNPTPQTTPTVEPAPTPDEFDRVDLSELTPCAKCGGLELWESMAGDKFGLAPGRWRCVLCDPPALPIPGAAQ